MGYYNYQIESYTRDYDPFDKAEEVAKGSNVNKVTQNGVNYIKVNVPCKNYKDLSIYEAKLYASKIAELVSFKFDVNMNDNYIRDFYQEAELHRLYYYPEHFFSLGTHTDTIDIVICWDGTVKDDREEINFAREFIIY